LELNEEWVRNADWELQVGLLLRCGNTVRFG